MERIGKWEFENDRKGRLTYRLSAASVLVGWIAGSAIACALLYGSYSLFLQQAWGWAVGMGIFGVGAVWVLIKNQMLRSSGCVLDNRADQFRADDAVKCRLSDVQRVACEWHIPASRPGSPGGRGSYQVYLLLHSGERIHTYLGEYDENDAQRQAQILSDFLAEPVPERAVSRVVGI